jgi:hypothetical protein
MHAGIREYYWHRDWSIQDSFSKTETLTKEKRNMKKQLLTVLMMAIAISMFSMASPLYAQGGQWGNGHGNHGGGNGPGEFIDENGDGYNDLAPDDDGDGIPNYADDDYVRPEDGQGQGNGHGNGNGPGEFIDEDGDGYNDLAPDDDGDGIPNYADEDFVRPHDGEGRGHGGRRPGFGRGNGPGTGDCLPDPVARQKSARKVSISN